MHHFKRMSRLEYGDTEDKKEQLRNEICSRRSQLIGG